MNVPDLSSHSIEDLKTLIAAANDELERRKQEHIAQGEKLGLACVDGNAGPKRRGRRPKHHQDGV
jgi:hypothetical protein